jgi:hypothetical protein
MDNTNNLNGDGINQSFEEQRQIMRNARLSKPRPVADDFSERIRERNERAQEDAEIASGERLPYPVCDLETAARWIGCSAQTLRNLAMTLPILQGAVRNAPGGEIEFYSGALYAHKAFILRTLGIRRPHKAIPGQKSVSIYPTRDEIIKLAGIKVK